MNKLTINNKTLLLEGASVTGSFIEGYYYVEEMLLVKDADELFKFCTWIDKKVGSAGRGNIEQLFLAFKKPEDVELQKFVKELRTFFKKHSF